MPDPTVEVVPYESLHQPLSPLFLDYLSGREGARPFLGPDGFDLAAISAAAERAAALERPRAAVAEALVRQQEARGATRAAERASAFAEPGATAIVTGQQAGLFGGPAPRPVEGPGHGRGGAAARGGARPSRGARLLGGVRRPRLRRDPLHEPDRRRRDDPHAALRPAPRAGRPAGLGHPPRRHGRPRSWTSSARRCRPPWAATRRSRWWPSATGRARRCRAASPASSPACCPSSSCSTRPTRR